MLFLRSNWSYFKQPATWLLPRKVRSERIQQIFARRSLKDALNDKFLEALQKRRHDVHRERTKLFVTNVTALAILLLCLLPLQFRVSLFGITPENLKQLREILLVICAGVTSRQVPLFIESRLIRETIEAALQTRARTDPELLHIFKLRFGLWQFPHHSLFHPDARTSPGMLYKSLFVVFSILSNTVTPLAIGFASLIIEVWGAIDIYREPTVSRALSISVIGYWALTLLTSMLFIRLEDFPSLYRVKPHTDSGT